MSKLQKDFKQRIDLLDKRDKGLDEGYYFNQNDIGTATILAEITTGTKPVNLTDASVSLSVLTPDGNREVSICPVVNPAKGIARLSFTRDMLTTPGLARFQVTVQKGLQVVVSNTFYFSINDSIMQDDDVGNLGDIETLPLLIKLQAHASTVINNEAKILNRVENLEVKVISSEAERDYAEKFRVENENNRILAEEERHKRHLERIGIDKKIDTTFNALTKNIDTIYKDEQERVNNEKLRVERYETITNGFKEIYESEKERQDNEQYRIDTFSNVTTGEDERIKNENLRVLKENERIKNEKIRASREDSRLALDIKIQDHFSKANTLITNFERTVEQHEKDIQDTKNLILNTNKTVIDGEKKRVQAENQRISEEYNRRKEEQIRIENEKLREQMYFKAKDDLEKLNAVADETKLQEYVDKKILDKADVEHNHNIEDIKGLVYRLDKKVDVDVMNSVVNNLQPSGDYVKWTELNHELDQKISKQELEESENVLRSKIDSSEKILQRKIGEKSPLIHKHYLSEIYGLEEALDTKFEKADIKKYLTISDFNTILDRKLDKIADNDKIQGIIEELSVKATKEDLFDSEKSLKDWVGNVLNSYQTRGNYATKSDLANYTDDILRKIVDNEKIESIEKNISNSNTRITNIYSELSEKYRELDDEKADYSHTHSYRELSDIPSNLLTTESLSNVLKDYIQRGYVLTTDIIGCSGYLVTDLRINKEGFFEIDTINNRGSQITKFSDKKVVTIDDFNSAKSSLQNKIDNKADKLTISSLESRLNNKADISRVTTIESEIGKIDDFFVDTINMIHREIGN